MVDKNHEAEIEARLMVVAARAHRSLTGDELNTVRRRIERDLEQREEMRTLPLANGDAPASGNSSQLELGGSGTW